ncbi:MAG: transglutaminase-like domain-containing protein [Pseudomonadota bacterium]
MAQIKRVLKGIANLPCAKRPGDFDRRAGLIWRWVASNITYRAHEPATDPDDPMTRLTEFYQFPAETIALGRGDCEDSAFLLASLLVASGISDYCVRVVMGKVKWRTQRPSEPHVWVIYKDECGAWRILEPTINDCDLPDTEVASKWPTADGQSKKGTRPWYVPNLGVNRTHVWSIGEILDDDVEGFVIEHLKIRLKSRWERRS